MTFGSVCSGIEAAGVAWCPLGWHSAFFAEVDPFPSAVLAHHYPETPNLGDFTTIEASAGPIDVLVGGTPCQSFSVAGLRKGLADDRGNLALEFIRLAYRLRPRWVVWENVPGVLSSNKGRDFACFLGGLTGLDIPVPRDGWKNSGIIPGASTGHFGCAYRVLDARYFGVPQRRRRVFVVGHLGDWRGCTSVLFERDCLSGHPAPGRETRASVTRSAGEGFTPGRFGGYRPGAVPLRAEGGDCGRGSETLIVHAPEVAYCLKAEKGRNENGSHVGQGWNTNYIAHTLRADGFDASEDGTGLGTPLVPVTAPILFASAQGGTVVKEAMAVRRLTPRECERLQGFPDNYTLVNYRGKPAADGPRYRAIGNSMAVPVMRWIGRRIALVRALPV